MYCIYLLATFYGSGYKITMTCLYLIGAFVSYIGNRNWSFRHDGDVATSAVKYIFAHICGYLINLLLLVIFVDYFEFPHQLVQIVAIVIVALFLFLLFRFYVFAGREGGSGGAA